MPRQRDGPQTPTVGQVSRLRTFVVDYDLPADFRRKRFYRAIGRYLASQGLEDTGWSTGSVVFTGSEAFAWRVYEEARKTGGIAHVWRAECIDEEKY